MKYLILSLCAAACFIISCNSDASVEASQSGPFPQLSETDSLDIVNTFMATQDAWNRGDLEAFMEAYWRSDSVAFVGSSGPIYGYESTLRRYQESYPDTTAMGQLEFDILRLYQIDQTTALMIGKFYLTRSIADLQGHYTLVWRKIGDDWVVVSDHSSGEEVEEG